MGSKTVVKVPVKDAHNDIETFIPLGILEGNKQGPTLGVIAGVHASEFAAADGSARFWASLKPADVSGRVIVALVADVVGALGGRPSKQLAGIDTTSNPLGTNPIDKKNLNRIWPGKADGTLTEVIAHTLMRELVMKSDAVVDCHGGEYNEYMLPYTITCAGGKADLDARTVEFAKALGVPFIEITDANGNWLGVGTSIGETVRSGRSGAMLEIGDRGIRDELSISQTFHALDNALMHLGMKAGKPAPWAATPVLLKKGIIMRTRAGGIYVPKVTIGEWIDAGQTFAEIHDFDNAVLDVLKAPEAGLVLTVVHARCVKAEAFAGKIGVV